MNNKINQQTTIHCFRCGICCSLYQVHIDLSELQMLAMHLNISHEEFISNYADPRWPGENTFLLRHVNGACIFIETFQNNITSCKIHSFRPQDCRNWMAIINKPECQKGLLKWGLELDEKGNIRGNDSDIKRFNEFLESSL